MGRQMGWTKPKVQSEMVKFLASSKHIKFYTQKSRKHHFGLNGSGLESQFDYLQKSNISDFNPINDAIFK